MVVISAESLPTRRLLLTPQAESLAHSRKLYRNPRRHLRPLFILTCVYTRNSNSHLLEITTQKS